MGKHVERTAQTKQALMDAFWELYCDNKIEKITVKAVTDKAGFYRSTFYEYFADVYDVLNEIEEGIMARHRVAIRDIFQSEDVTSVQAKGLAFCKENIEYLAILLGPDGDPKFRTLAKDNIRLMAQELLHIDDNDPTIEVAIELFSGAIISLMLYWYNHQDSLALPEVFAMGSNVLQKGIFSMVENWDIPFLKN